MATDINETARATLGSGWTLSADDHPKCDGHYLVSMWDIALGQWFPPEVDLWVGSSFREFPTHVLFAWSPQPLPDQNLEITRQ